MHWKFGQQRLLYLVSAVAVMALGLASRRYGAHLPGFVAEYGGDTLWALMAYLGIGVVMPGTPVHRRWAMAVAFAFAIEISQLYHAPWIDSLRRTMLGGLVLGFGFLWTDFICYTVGASIGAGMEYVMRSKVK